MHQPPLTYWSHTWSNYQWLSMIICIIIDSCWLNLERIIRSWDRQSVVQLLDRLLNQSGSLSGCLSSWVLAILQAIALTNLFVCLRWLIYIKIFIWLSHSLSGSCFVCLNSRRLALGAQRSALGAWRSALHALPELNLVYFLHTYLLRLAIKWAGKK